ncbi:hypothetical protein C6A90_02400 [Proteus mirabilis]|nr:hypothetical protein EHQ78_08230 [Proteus mirabilis]RCE56256.1 hypothetical protein C6A90_02400 [Proteus mirabilis]
MQKQFYYYLWFILTCIIFLKFQLFEIVHHFPLLSADNPYGYLFMDVVFSDPRFDEDQAICNIWHNAINININ